jgi:hypothetical protein
MRPLIENEINRISSLMFEQITGFEGRLERTFEDPEKAQKWLDTFVIRDTHDALVLISLTSGLLGMLPSPLSPVLLGISLASDLANATLYFNEGDKYTAGILAALSIIPGHQLFQQIKNLKTLEKVGIEEAKRLLQLNSRNLGTQAERRTARQIIQEFLTNAKKVTPLVVTETLKRILTNLSKKSLKFVMNFLWVLFAGSKSLLDQTLIIGGIAMSFDKIYCAVFSDDPKMMSLRNNNSFAKIIKLVENNQEEIKQQLLSLNDVKSKLKSQIEKGEHVQYVGSEKMNYEILSEFRKKHKETLKKQKQSELMPPTFDDVLSKKISSITNKPVTIHKGQKGQTIKKLQSYLIDLGYEYILTGMGYLELGGDGNFGEWTEDTVKEFQKDNSLSVDGIVGFETLTKILNKLKK